MYFDRTLQNSYTMYAMNKKKGWSAQAIKPMATFKTVEEFWGMY